MWEKRCVLCDKVTDDGLWLNEYNFLSPVCRDCLCTLNRWRSVFDRDYLVAKAKYANVNFQCHVCQQPAYERVWYTDKDGKDICVRLCDDCFNDYKQNQWYFVRKFVKFIKSLNDKKSEW